MNKKQLLKAYQEGIITEEKFKEQLFKLETEKKDRPKTPKRIPVSISYEEWVQLIKKTLKDHHKVAFLLGFGAGLRISEITNLEVRDVDYANKTILVRQGKGGKDRIVPLPKGFKVSALKYIPLKCGVRSLQRAFKRAARRANLLEKKPTLHFHSLRHGFATQLVSNGVPIHHVRTLMGHSNISTTNVYLEANPKEALKNYEELF